LRTLLAASARDEEEIALIAELLGLPSSAPTVDLSPQRKRQKIFEALLHQFEALAQHQPVLAVFEDVHWIDPTSRELLDLMVATVERLPVLLLISFRPELQEAWSGQPQVTTLALNRLGGRDGAALVQYLSGDTALAPEIVAEIAHLWHSAVCQGADQGGARKRRTQVRRGSDDAAAVVGHSGNSARLVGRAPRPARAGRQRDRADRRGIGPGIFLRADRSSGAAHGSRPPRRARPGRRTKARELLTPVYGWFTEGFDTAMLKEAAALISQLA
jgi:hypothetical protein